MTIYDLPSCPPDTGAESAQFLDWCDTHHRDPECDQALEDWHDEIEFERACDLAEARRWNEGTR